MRKCKQYLAGELPEGPFRVFHKSFADFLLEDEDNVHRHIDGMQIHRQIAIHYKGNAVTWTQVDWSKVDDYGLRYLTSHLYQLRNAAGYSTELYEAVGI